MKIENQVSSIEPSKKLKELGVKQDSVWYWEIETCKLEPYKGQQHIFLLNRVYNQKVSNDYDYEYYSAYTVAECLEILNEEVTIPKDVKNVADFLAKKYLTTYPILQSKK